MLPLIRTAGNTTAGCCPSRKKPVTRGEQEEQRQPIRAKHFRLPRHPSRRIRKKPKSSGNNLRLPKRSRHCGSRRRLPASHHRLSNREKDHGPSKWRLPITSTVRGWKDVYNAPHFREKPAASSSFTRRMRLPPQRKTGKSFIATAAPKMLWGKSRQYSKIPCATGG